jgi:hypothetical protein
MGTLKMSHGRDGNAGNGTKSGRESGRERLSENYRDGNPGRERTQKSSGRDGTGREVPVPPPALLQTHVGWPAVRDDHRA